MGNDTAIINSGSQEESGNEAHDPPRLEGEVSGLALLKRKMEEIYLEWKKFQTEQAKLSDTVDKMLSSLNGLSDEMITMRKDMTQLSTTFREEISDFKRILLSQNGTKIASPRRERVARASSKEESSSGDDVVFNIGSESDSKDKGKASNRAHRSRIPTHGIVCVKLIWKAVTPWMKGTSQNQLETALEERWTILRHLTVTTRWVASNVSPGDTG
jgi:hypothetical protein